MVDIQINEQSARLLQDAMRAADRKTDWHVQKQANKAMYFICRSAGAAMKPKSMRSKRKVVKNPKGRGAKFLIEVLHQDKPRTFLPTNSRADKRRKIAKLGLARTTMRIAAGKFGRRPAGSMTKGGKKFVRAISRHTKNKSKVAVINSLTYLFEAFPGIVDKAINNGMRQFIHGFDKDWASALKAGKS